MKTNKTIYAYVRCSRGNHKPIQIPVEQISALLECPECGRDINQIVVENISKCFGLLQMKSHSENIKRGIRAARERRALQNRHEK